LAVFFEKIHPAGISFYFCLSAHIETHSSDAIHFFEIISTHPNQTPPGTSCKLEKPPWYYPTILVEMNGLTTGEN